jgi:hypothetical protein
MGNTQLVPLPWKSKVKALLKLGGDLPAEPNGSAMLLAHHATQTLTRLKSQKSFGSEVLTRLQAGHLFPPRCTSEQL